MNSWLPVVVTALVGAAIGWFSSRRVWYAALASAILNPDRVRGGRGGPLMTEDYREEWKP